MVLVLRLFVLLIVLLVFVVDSVLFVARLVTLVIGLCVCCCFRCPGLICCRVVVCLLGWFCD